MSCGPLTGVVDDPVEEEEEEGKDVPCPPLLPALSCGYESPNTENTAELPSCEDSQYMKSSSNFILADGKDERCRLPSALDKGPPKL